MLVDLMTHENSMYLKTKFLTCISLLKHMLWVSKEPSQCDTSLEDQNKCSN